MPGQAEGTLLFMLSFRDYVASLKERTGTFQILVIGNEAADLDSTVSSLCYAYLSTTHHDIPAIPVVNCFRCDFPLRKEISYLLLKTGIMPDDLLFIDDVLFDEFPENFSLVLIDHNQPGLSLDPYSAKVTGIIDHHDDSGLFQTVSPRIIQQVGSTATLVAQEFVRERAFIDKDVACLLLAAILLDTLNLSQRSKKATAADNAMASVLTAICEIDGKRLFKILQMKRHDINGMTVVDLLRRDYKEYQIGKIRYGVAVVCLDSASLHERDVNILKTLKEYQRDRNLEFLVLMLVTTQPHFRREMIVVWDDDNAQDSLFTVLQEKGFGLSLLRGDLWKIDPNGSVRIYGQANEALSRKVLHPLLTAFLDT